MNKDFELKRLKNRLSIIQNRNKKGNIGIIKKLNRQIRNLSR